MIFSHLLALTVQLPLPLHHSFDMLTAQFASNLHGRRLQLGRPLSFPVQIPPHTQVISFELAHSQWVVWFEYCRGELAPKGKLGGWPVQSSWLLKKGVWVDLRRWWSCSTEVYTDDSCCWTAYLLSCTLFIISAPTLAITIHNSIFRSGF